MAKRAALVHPALEALLQRAPVGMVWCEAGQIRWLAGATLATLGLDRRSIGRKWAESLPPQLVATLHEPSPAHVALHGKTWEVQWIGAPGDGLLLLRPLPADQAALHQDAALLDAILEHLPGMIFVKDAETLRFVRINRAAEALMGHPRQAVLGKGDYDFFPAVEADFFTGKDRAVLDARKPVDIPEERIHAGDGEVRLLHTRKVPLLDEAGIPRYLLGLSWDITEHKRVEAERDALLDRLERLDRLKIRFVSDLSHELRTPMALITGLTERVLKHPDMPAPRRRDLQDVLHAVRLLRGLVDALMEVSRLEETQATLNYVEVDLARQTRLTAGAFDTMASHREIRLTVEAPASLMAQVDLHKFDRILINLLANALRFTPTGGAVRCLLGTRENTIILGVQDSGPGLPGADPERVFSRFHAGTEGVSLSIARVLARLHGGDIILRDHPDASSWFEVQLPRWAPRRAKVSTAPPDLHPPEPTAQRPAPAAPLPTTRERRPLVLIVQSDPQSGQDLAQLLSARYQITQAHDGISGLKKARQLAPELVITDANLPRMSGAELIRALRRDPRLADVSILVLTERPEPSAAYFLKIGAQDYLTKPFSEDELQTRAQSALTVKRTRDLLQRELASRDQDLVGLASQLAERSRELENALDTAVVARQQAERALKLRADFLALVAHEVRTPMQALKLGLEVLQRRSGDAPLPPEVARVVRAGDRLHRLVESMLDYATAESARAEMHPQRVDLVRLVREVTEGQRRRAEEKGLSLRLNCEVLALSIQTDPRLVRLILTNLLDNAIKFTSSGSVTVTVESRELGAVVRVRDTGPGISPKAMRDVFEPFTHLAPVRTKHLPGTGLGLALVREIAHTLGGEVRADSTVGIGSTFTLTLPLRVSAPER